MFRATLDDGREVLVDTSQEQVRMVKKKEFFVDSLKYVTVLLGGGWQVVRKDRIKKVAYGNPFQELER